MASEKQFEANRNNAQKSTGPGDTSVTRYNATRYGFRGSRVVLSNESMDEYNQMYATLHAVFRPRGTYENALVKRIADRLWELERAGFMKAQVIEHSWYRDTQENELRILEGYETSIERSLYRTRRELLQLQRERGQLYRPPDDAKGLFAPEKYEGPKVEYLNSQGEEALDNLVTLAKREMLRNEDKYGRKGLKRTVNRMADVALATEVPIEDDAKGGNPGAPNAPRPPDGS